MREAYEAVLSLATLHVLFAYDTGQIPDMCRLCFSCFKPEIQNKNIFCQSNISKGFTLGQTEQPPYSFCVSVSECSIWFCGGGRGLFFLSARFFLPPSLSRAPASHFLNSSSMSFLVAFFVVGFLWRAPEKIKIDFMPT